MRALKQCINCKKYTKKTITFGAFPTECHKWCSEKCLFIWILKHNVKFNGEIVDTIENKKGMISSMTDLVTVDDMTRKQ